MSGQGQQVRRRAAGEPGGQLVAARTAGTPRPAGGSARRDGRRRGPTSPATPVSAGGSGVECGSAGMPRSGSRPSSRSRCSLTAPRRATSISTSPPGRIAASVAARRRPSPRRAMAGGSASRTRSAAEDPAGARVAQHQSVVDRQRQVPVQAEPGVVVVERSQSGRHRSLPTCTVTCSGASVNGRPVLRRTSSSRVTGHAPAVSSTSPAADVVRGDAAQVQRNPVHRTECRLRSPLALQPADHHGPNPVAAQHVQPVTDRDRAGGQGSGDHGAGAGAGEAAVHPDPDPPGHHRRRHRGEHVVEGVPQLVEALTGGRPTRRPPGRRADRCRRARPAPGRARRGHPVGCQVEPAEHDQAVLDAQRGDRVAVVARLRPPALVRGDDEADHRRRAESGEHVAEKALVTGHVDEGDVASGRQCGPGEAEVDGQAAAALLRPAVRFHSGERSHQGALAVVDVAGGGDDEHSGVRARSRPRSGRALDAPPPARRRRPLPACTAGRSGRRRRAPGAAPPGRPGAARAPAALGQPHRPAGQRHARAQRHRRPGRRAAPPSASTASASRSARARSRSGSACSACAHRRRARRSGSPPARRGSACPRGPPGPADGGPAGGRSRRDRGPARPAGRRAVCRRSWSRGRRRRRARRRRPAPRAAAGSGASSPLPRSNTSGTPCCVGQRSQLVDGRPPW